jgi:hypothetical protein
MSGSAAKGNGRRVSKGCARLRADQVESANIVGYQTLAATGQYFSSGPTFITVGDANGEWKLGNISATGIDPSSDFIQFLNPSTAATELYATYVDLDTAGGDAEAVGWYNLDLDTKLDDQVFAAGTGFLSSFANPAFVTLTYVGEVLQEETTLDLSGQNYPFVANFTPVDLTLGDLAATGMNPDSDFVQFLSPSTAATGLYATYVDLDTAGGDTELVGWYNLDLDTPLNDTPFPAGTAFLGSLVSAGVTIKFPSPVQ